PVGLKNIGNTCYLNSILQCLFSILPVRTTVMCFGDGKTWNEELRLGRRDGGRLLTKDEIATALKFVERLKALFESLISQRVEGWAAKRVRVSSGGHPLASAVAAAPLAVTPDRELADMLLLRVGSSSSANTSTAYFSAGGQQQNQQQQDVDECMAQCVGLMVHALPPASLMDSSEQDMADSSERTRDLSGPGDTWIYKLLAGTLEVATGKVGVGQPGTPEKPLNEAFLNLNLNIPDETTDINDCIDSFFAPSAISSDNSTAAIEPPANASDAMDTDSGQLIRRSRLKDAPPVLCIQVQRVQFDMRTMRAFKINSHLRLREQVSLTPYGCFDGAAASARARRRELLERLSAVNQHLRALQVPMQAGARTSGDAGSVQRTAADGSDSVSVISALERVQTFMRGVGRWAETDDSRALLADLPQRSSEIIQSADQITTQLTEISTTLNQARDQWEHELRDIRAQLESIYEDVPQDDTAYTLHAVFIHNGHTPEFGHYWVYIRDFDREKNLVRWLKFNDSQVSVVEPAEIFRDAPKAGEEAANPYYLVYVRSSCIDATADLGV
ncbi:ubiquitin-specific protease ubp2, partial [Coemansia erecta]